MENNLTKFHRVMYKSAVWVSTLIMAVIFTMSFFAQSRVKMDSSERISFHTNHVLVYISLLILAVLIWAFKEKIRNLSGKRLFGFGVIVYLLAGAFFIMALGRDLKGDAYMLRQAMECFSRGDYYFLGKGHYISRYPHQLGMVSFERILSIFSQDVKICFIANLLLVLINNWTTWKISCLIFPDHALTQNLTILLSFLFLPQFFFIAFVYGTIPGFSMLLLASYFQIKYLKEARKMDFLLLAVFAALACILRSNNLIGIIALSIIFVLEAIKKRNIKWIAAALALMVCVSAGTKALNVYYEKESGERIINAEPKILWVAMGLRDEGWGLGGWYDGFNNNTYESVDYDSQKATMLAKESIAKSMEKFKDFPQYAFKFFGEKVMSTWCDPLFQSIWSGPVKAMEQSVDNERLSVLYNEDTEIHKITRQYCQVLLIFIYAASLLFLLQEIKNKNSDGYLFAFIYFVGGVLFHIVWETKSQYVYPYVFAMIPYMANAVDSVFAKIKRKDKIAAGSVLEVK